MSVTEKVFELNKPETLGYRPVERKSGGRRPVTNFSFAVLSLDNPPENVKIQGNFQPIHFKGGETGSTEVEKFTWHAEVLTARKTVGLKANADDYAYAVAA